MELVLPSKEFYLSYLSYIEELGEEERYPFTLDIDFSDFDEFLVTLENYSTGKQLLKQTVQNTTYWLVDDGEIVGVTNIRHYLNRQIEHCGGHIGLGIRPSERGKGAGKLLMELSICKLLAMGVNPVHIHCYRDNNASASLIKANGGQLESEFIEDDTVIQRYIVLAK